MSRIGTEGPKVCKFWSVREWVAGHLGGIRHERRVAAIASSLVKITLPLHDLTAGEVRLLKMAALVHDVGRCLSDKHHPSIGARMILRDQALPLKKRHRRPLAYLTLRHRGGVPLPQDDRALRPGDDAEKLRVLLGFLRAADALDGRSLPSPGLSFTRRGRRVRITCLLRDDSAKSRRTFTRRKKFRLLEEMLDCKIEVSVEAQRRLHAVA